MTGGRQDANPLLNLPNPGEPRWRGQKIRYLDRLEGHKVWLFGN